MIINTKDYLAHHGISGQKWGVRRYQNEDGSLTPEGYEHYGYKQNGKVTMKSADKFLSTAKVMASHASTKEKKQKLNTKIDEIKALRNTDPGAYVKKTSDFLNSKAGKVMASGAQEVRNATSSKVMIGASSTVATVLSAAALNSLNAPSNYYSFTTGRAGAFGALTAGVGGNIVSNVRMNNKMKKGGL